MVHIMTLTVSELTQTTIDNLAAANILLNSSSGTKEKVEKARFLRTSLKDAHFYGSYHLKNTEDKTTEEVALQNEIDKVQEVVGRLEKRFGIPTKCENATTVAAGSTILIGTGYLIKRLVFGFGPILLNKTAEAVTRAANFATLHPSLAGPVIGFVTSAVLTATVYICNQRKQKQA